MTRDLKPNGTESHAKGHGPNSVAVVLDACGTQAWQAVLVYRALPGQKFVHRQPVAFASLTKGQQTATNSQYDFSLAANNPTLGVRRWQISNRQRAAIWSNYVTQMHPVIFTKHLTLYILQWPDEKFTVMLLNG